MWEKTLKKLSSYFGALDTPANAESRAFLWLWSLSFYLNYAESWDFPELTFSVLAICVGTLLIKKLEWAWALYLVSSTVILAYKFPIVANHSVYNLFVNLYLIYLFLRGRLTPLDTKAARNILISLAVVYFCAGVHKINSDYLFSPTSCALSFMERIDKTYFNGALPHFFTHNALVPAGTVALEVLIAILLLSRRTFYIGLLLAMSFHMILAALEFIDFSMNSLSILVLALGAMAASRKGSFKRILDVIPYYVLGQLLAGLVSFFESSKGRGTWGYHFQTALFVSFSLWVLYHGVKVSFEVRNSKETKLSFKSYLFPAFIFVFACFNYIGLSTAGTFSMFSNLRTEGDSWNHLFIPKFVRVFPYQDRVYWVEKLPSKVNRANREHPRENHGMPEIEFARVLETWKERDYRPKYFEYTLGDLRHRSEKITEQDPFEGRTYSWLERKAFFFRRIQRFNEPNKCRW